MFYDKTLGYNRRSEVTAGDVPKEKVFLEISQNSQENTSARACFLMKL